MGKKRDKRKAQHPERAPAIPAPQHNRARPRRAVFALLGLVLAGGGVFLYARFQPFRGPRIASASLAGANVLLVTLDTTRADHLPAYGYKGVKTPGLDRVAEKSFIFENAIAQVPLTLPSHTTILTGQLPIWHGVRDNEGFFVDPKKATTLAAILKARGYATAAFVSAFVLDGRWGLNQGFDTYFDHFDQFREVNRDEIQRKAAETEAEAEGWLLSNKDKRFFLWVHFYDPHEPYDPPEPFASAYAANRYDGEIAYMDQSLARLMAKLETLGLSERTLVVVTGDHGEGLGEHDEATHAMFLYDTTLHVPLFIRVPGGRERRLPGIVRHIDVAPTILDLLGFPPESDMQGASLIPLINGAEKSGRTAYSESIYAQVHYGWSPLKSITTRKYQYIDSPKAELFDREDDPGQRRNLIETKSSVAGSLKEQLQEVVDQFTRKDLAGPAKMDADTEAKLRALGYLGSPVASTPESLKTDPKDKSRFVRDVNEGVKLLARRDFQGALRLVLPVAEADPNIVDAHLVAGSAYSNLQQYDKALAELFKVVAAKPDHTMALATIATTYEGMGQLREAERWYLKVLRGEKDHPYTIVKLASLYRRLNDPAKAEQYLGIAMRPVNESLKTTQEPKPRSKLFAARAEMYYGANRVAEAESDLKDAIALTPREPNLHFNLAQVYESARDLPNAIENYRKETEVAPGNSGAYMNLGLLCFQTGQVDAASTAFQRLRQLTPGDPRAAFLLAETYNALNRNLDEAIQLTRQGLGAMPEYKRGYVLMAEVYKKLGREKEAQEALAMAGSR
jgi:arylsulfatase A-like enzyme/Tfp pilus assembly protein PilF